MLARTSHVPRRSGRLIARIAPCAFEDARPSNTPNTQALHANFPPFGGVGFVRAQIVSDLQRASAGTVGGDTVTVPISRAPTGVGPCVRPDAKQILCFLEHQWSAAPVGERQGTHCQATPPFLLLACSRLIPALPRPGTPAFASQMSLGLTWICALFGLVQASLLLKKQEKREKEVQAHPSLGK